MADAVLAALERDEAYRVVRVLAEKTSGSTELVVPERTGMPFYVRKRIPIALANPEAWAQLAQISHPHLPHVVETYALPDTFVTVCDYVEGFSVEQLVASRGRLDTAQALSILADVCDAAGALHARGIIHRDITPGNVVVAADGAHLIDLGIARVGDATARHDTTRLGTWGFAAPEQFGFAQTDARSDVYSIGSLAGFMLTGVRPDQEGFDAAVAALPAGLAAVIERARAFEPSARYASAAELNSAFSAAPSGARGKASAASPLKDFFISPRDMWNGFTRASFGKIAALALGIACYVAMLGGMFSTSFSYFATGDIAGGAVGTIFSLCFVWLAYDIVGAVLGAGPYEQASSRPALLLKRSIVAFAVVLAVCLVLAAFDRILSRYSAGS